MLDALRPLREQYELFPIMSPIVYETNTRFGTATHFKERLQGLCGREIWHTIPQVEPIGPKNLLDALLIAPCTANTLAKLAHKRNSVKPAAAAIVICSAPRRRCQ